MEKEKLDALRAKFSSAGDRNDAPAYDPLAATPTLLNAPAGLLTDGLDIALIGVPMDLGVTCRAGARFGPKAVRGWQRVGPHNHSQGFRPMDRLRCADIGDVPFRSQHQLISCIEDIEIFYNRITAAGVRPLSVGGDHSITFPILKALGREKPVGLFHIDAHCDTEESTPSSKFHHGTPFRNAVLEGVLDPDRSIQIGIRGNALECAEFSYESGMTVVTMRDFEDQGLGAVIDTAMAVLGDAPFYMSIDIDGIDPAFAAGTGTPEIGGLTPREVIGLIRSLAGKNIIGGDVVEIAPDYDLTSNTVQLGAGLLFEILGSMAAKT